MKGEDKYEDIINTVYPLKTSRPRMSLHDRAAQFSPFAALTGYDALIRETERLADSRFAPGESEEESPDWYPEDY